MKRFLVLSALCSLYLATMLAFGAYIYSTSLRALREGPPDVVCWEMPQSDLKRGGWKRMAEVDRGQIAYRASLGRVEIKAEEPSLKCREYVAGDSTEFIAREYWWREKPIHKRKL